MMNILMCILFLVLFTACGSKPKKNDLANKTVAFCSIDLEKKYPEKEFRLEEMAEVEFIPLETSPDVLLDAGALMNLVVSDSIVVTHNSDGTVFIFNRKGRIHSFFNHLGRSGEEYLYISQLTVDFEREEIYIYCVTNYKIYVYSYFGDFKRIVRLPSTIWLGEIFHYSDEFLLCYDQYNLGFDEKKVSRKPYLLLNKFTGEIIELDIFLEQRIPSWIKQKSEDGGEKQNALIGVLCSNMIKNGQDVIITDYGSDTIYCLKDNVLTPLAEKVPSVKTMNTPILFFVYLKTDRYLFMRSIKKIMDSDGKFPPAKEFVYDNETGDLYNPKWIEKEAWEKRKINLLKTELPANYGRGFFSALQLIEEYKAGNLQGPLKEIASKIKENDNPVLVLVKFEK